MNKFILLIVFSVSFLFSIGSQDAFAVGGTISDPASCEAIGGTWIAFSSPAHCRIDTSITINSGEALTVSAGIEVRIDSDVVIKNMGTIINNGFIQNSGTIINDGGKLNIFDTLDNRGGTITNGVGSFINSFDGIFTNDGGFIDNRGTININGVDSPLDPFNWGTIENRGAININSAGTVHNKGTIKNIGGSIRIEGSLLNEIAGSIINDGDSTISNVGGFITNKGTIDNRGTISNAGTLDNRDGATINNTGTITNHDTIDNSDFGFGPIINNNAGGIIDNKDTINTTNGILNNCNGTILGSVNGPISNCPPTARVIGPSSSCSEGNSGTTTCLFLIRITESADAIVSVSTDDSIATVADNDYIPITRSIFFEAGASPQQAVLVEIVGDTVVEGTEFVVLEITSCTNCKTEFFQDSVSASISNDDSATIAISDVSMNEGNSGTTQFAFDVTLSNPVDIPITVDFSTDDDSANSPNDYSFTNGELIWPALSTDIFSINVEVNGDTDVELNENFFVNLQSNSITIRDVTFSNNQGIGNILNDDQGFNCGPGTTPNEITRECDPDVTQAQLDGVLQTLFELLRAFGVI